MKSLPATLALLPLIALSACDTSQLSNAADNARAATEHMADGAQVSSRAREAKVLATARGIEQQQAHQLAVENGGRPRYEIRKDGPTWTVYDTENNRPARVGPHLQSGLDHDKAVSIFQDLQDDEEMQNALMSSPNKPLPPRH